MLDIFLKIFDSIFPPPESIIRLKKETPEDFIKYFSPHRFANCIALSDYSNPIIKAAVTANKFHNHEEAAVLLCVLVEHWLDTLPKSPTIFVPIPLSSTREKSRGYNQVKRVLEKSQNKNIVISDILTRHKDTKPQTSLNRIERFKNIEGAFSYQETEKKIPSYSRIIILDDVVTTGATLIAAQNSLLPHINEDCEIICLAIAH